MRCLLVWLVVSLSGCATTQRPISVSDDRDFYHDQDAPDDIGAASIAARAAGAPEWAVSPAYAAASAASWLWGFLGHGRPDPGAEVPAHGQDPLERDPP